jgi:hypothetical protein
VERSAIPRPDHLGKGAISWGKVIIESEFQIGRPHQNQTIFFKKAALSVLSIGYWVEAAL